MLEVGLNSGVLDCQLLEEIVKFEVELVLLGELVAEHALVLGTLFAHRLDCPLAPDCLQIIGLLLR